MKRWTAPILVFGFVLLGMRLLLMIDAYAVNVLYWDQWEFFEALFDDATFWETFRWQHGPHRQGLGLLLTRSIAELSGWNTRVEALVCGVLAVSSAGVFLWLRSRLSGPLRVTDLAIPVLVLTPAQYGAFLHTVNPAHGHVPLLLLACYAAALGVSSPRPRTASIVALNFLLVHTGFGLFVGLLTPCGFALAARRAKAGSRGLPALGLVLSLATGIYFGIGFQFEGAAAVPALAPADGIRYWQFVSLMFANLAGVKGAGPLATTVGTMLLAAGLLVVGPRALRILRGQDEPSDRVVVVLIGFSLLFCLATAVGRSGLGSNMAQSTRYVPLVLPFAVGILLHLAALPPGRMRTGLQVFALVAGVAATFPMRAPEAEFMEKLRAGKLRWVAVYRETHDPKAADAAAGLRIYSGSPETTRLREKLDWLEERQLNLFAPDE